MRRIWNSTIIRLSLLLVLVQIVALVLGLTAIHRFTEARLLADARMTAEMERDDFLDDYRLGGIVGLTDAVRHRLETPDDPNFIILLKDAEGRRLAGNLRDWPPSIADTAPWRRIWLYRPGGGAPDPMGLVAVRLPGGEALLTGEVLEAQQQLTHASEAAFLYSLAVAIVIAALMTALVAWILARRIDIFSQAANAFVAGQLDARVRRDETGDAFDRLALSINMMLGRIAALVRELRMVTDSMAHDLRSPVSRLKARLEQGLSQTRDADARVALGSAIDEADSLHRLLDTALEISRAEAGIGRDQFSRFDLNPLLGDLAELYGPLAEDHGFRIVIDCPPEISVFGHRELLMRALSNLIDNALKYAVDGSTIRIEAAVPGGGVLSIAVADDGLGLTRDEMSQATRRFVRLDAARGGTGAGLGLSLVETIAHLHNGTMRLKGNLPRGLRVTLLLAAEAALPAA